MISLNKTILKSCMAVLFLCAIPILFAQTIVTSTPQAEVAQTDALKSTLSGNVKTAIANLEQNLTTVTTDAEKKDILAVLASLQEQLGLFPEALVSFNAAAALADVGTIERQYFMLSAVRCALSSGDAISADFLLSTQLDKPLTAEISANKKLYALWSWLTKSENKNDISSVIAVLKTYSSLEDMASVKPVILFSLYELTEDSEWKKALINAYPDSPEVAILAGKAKLFPSPFWYFSLSKIE